jgi:hypothetical protein
MEELDKITALLGLTPGDLATIWGAVFLLTAAFKRKLTFLAGGTTTQILSFLIACVVSVLMFYPVWTPMIGGAVLGWLLADGTHQVIKTNKK